VSLTVLGIASSYAVHARGRHAVANLRAEVGKIEVRAACLRCSAFVRAGVDGFVNRGKTVKVTGLQDVWHCEA